RGGTPARRDRGGDEARGRGSGPPRRAHRGEGAGLPEGAPEGGVPAMRVEDPARGGAGDGRVLLSPLPARHALRPRGLDQDRQVAAGRRLYRLPWRPDNPEFTK